MSAFKLNKHVEDAQNKNNWRNTADIDMAFVIKF